MLDDSVLHLRWTINLEDDFNFYNVYRKSGNNNWNSYKSTQQTELFDTLRNSTTFSYAISALDFDKNESKKSDDHTILYSPRFSLIGPTNLISKDSNSTIFLSWKASTSIETIGYLVERQEGSSEKIQLIKELKNNETFYLDPYAKAKKKYIYYITAYDDKWNVSSPIKIEHSKE